MLHRNDMMNPRHATTQRGQTHSLGSVTSGDGAARTARRGDEPPHQEHLDHRAGRGRQTGRYAPAPADFQAAFSARLRALARSHETLIHAGWDAALLRDVVEAALAAHGGEPRRIHVEGVAALVQADLVVMASLAFHELAANAVKHGALSVPAGSVDVR